MKSGMNEAHKNVLTKFAKTSGSLSYSLKSNQNCLVSLQTNLYEKNFREGGERKKLADCHNVR